MARRTHLDIIFDMLLTIQQKGGLIKPTHLLYGANLSHQQLKKYSAELVDKGFVVVVEKDSDWFQITDKGHLYVKKIRDMREFEDAFDL